MTRQRPQLNELLLDSPRVRRHADLVLPRDEHFEFPERAIQFGTGAFLRGFVDYFLDCANHVGLFEGRLVAVSSTGSGRDQALADQDGLFTLAARGIQDGRAVESLRVVGVVSRALSAVDEWEAVLDVARSPDLEFIFSNTTEVGIVYDDTDAIDMSPPRSFPAKLARFLIERARAFEYDAAWSVVVLPCELIEDNGSRLREMVVRHAERWDVEPEFLRWLEAAVPFCNTLVDRIVPGAPQGDARAALEERLGFQDALLTACEPYRLFAIEADPAVRAMLRFADADTGIVISEDIAPYRERKVRLLNGAHTLMVPVALGMGLETVQSAVAHQGVGRFIRRAMQEEIAPYLDAPGAARFANDVLERFANPYVHHLLADITLQATMKVRVRLVPSIVRYADTVGAVPGALAFGFAAHLWLAGGTAAGAPETGRDDEQGAALRALWLEQLPNDGERARHVATSACHSPELWGSDLGTIAGFCDAVASHLERIQRDGMPAALDHFMATSADLVRVPTS